jgi:SulP family sulfate permease
MLPRRSDYAELPRSWRADLIAGATVGVVALPLALAFGITSGLGAVAGLVTAIVAGFVAAILGGSNVQVSGPTGAMTVVLVPIVARYGIDGVAVAGILAGVLVTAAAFGGLGRYLAFVPWPVIEGFTIGIAIIIFLQQVPAALGVARPEGENTALVAGGAILDAFEQPVSGALLIVGIVAAIMVVVPRLHRSAPASLIAVIIATFVAERAAFDVARIGELPSSLPAPSFPSITPSRISELFTAALAIAILAALESLLSAKVADGMMTAPRHDPDRELFGQGVANLLVPLFGGMPATGAIARTAVNVRSGARTRVAAIVHSVLLFGVVLFGGSLVGRIPISALAGVLVVTAVRMVEVHNVRAVVRATRGDAIVLTLTALATVVFDLILAVEIGIAIAAGLALRAVARTSSATIDRPVTTEDAEGSINVDRRILTYRIDGALFFGAAQRFLTELTQVSDAKVIVLRLVDVQVLDATGAQALGEIVAELEHRGVTVLIKGVRPHHIRTLEAIGVFSRLSNERHVFDRLDDALAHAQRHIAGSHDVSAN